MYAPSCITVYVCPNAHMTAASEMYQTQMYYSTPATILMMTKTSSQQTCRAPLIPPPLFSQCGFCIFCWRLCFPTSLALHREALKGYPWRTNMNSVIRLNGNWWLVDCMVCIVLQNPMVKEHMDWAIEQLTKHEAADTAVKYWINDDVVYIASMTEIEWLADDELYRPTGVTIARI